MTLSITELAEAKDAAASLLEQLGLLTYLFEVEPREDAWDMHVECVTSTGDWQAITFPVDAHRLRTSRADAAVRKELLAQWARHLAACRSTDAAPPGRAGP